MFNVVGIASSNEVSPKDGHCVHPRRRNRPCSPCSSTPQIGGGGMEQYRLLFAWNGALIVACTSHRVSSFSTIPRRSSTELANWNLLGHWRACQRPRRARKLYESDSRESFHIDLRPDMPRNSKKGASPLKESGNVLSRKTTFNTNRGSKESYPEISTPEKTQKRQKSSSCHTMSKPELLVSPEQIEVHDSKLYPPPRVMFLDHPIK